MADPVENKKPVFFNVMPEATSPGQSIKSMPRPAAPVIASDRSGEPAPNSAPIRMPRMGMNKKILLIPAVLIVLAILGAAVWFFVLKKDEAPVVTDPIVTEPEPTVTPDVTTPGDWLARYFQSETCTEINICGDKADPDRDGMNNKEEFDTGTDPNNSDSDKEGIADGDEKFVFSSDPLVGRTYREGNYNDADFIKGGYDVQTNAVLTAARLSEIKANIQEYGLHQPTISTLGDVAITLYGFDGIGDGEAIPNVDQSPEAKLDRDSQRRSTIKEVGAALLKYKAAKNSYPPVADFGVMVDMIRPYNLVATNYSDPINASKYVYGYSAVVGNQDFTLTYFSETANQLIKYSAKNAEEAAAKEATAITDEQRRLDVERIKSALMVYSNSKIEPDSGALYVFPALSEYPSAIVPKYMTELPKDPSTGKDYVYFVNEDLSSFSLKAILQSPPAGKTGYECNELDCLEY